MRERDCNLSNRLLEEGMKSQAGEKSHLKMQESIWDQPIDIFPRISIGKHFREVIILISSEVKTFLDIKLDKQLMPHSFTRLFKHLVWGEESTQFFEFSLKLSHVSSHRNHLSKKLIFCKFYPLFNRCHKVLTHSILTGQKIFPRFFTFFFFSFQCLRPEHDCYAKFTFCST